jgi:sulfate permease, SulP family
VIAFLEARRAGLFGRQYLAGNLAAGLIVGIVALPLSLAFAIASGARPEQGLYTALIAGLAGALFGGSRVQVTGPTGAFVAVLSVITMQHGIVGLQVATLMAGIILLALGLARLGNVIRWIPDPVIVGFTSGIGVVIFVGQWAYFMGLQPEASGLHFHEKLLALVAAVPALHLPTTLLALGSLAVLIVGPKVLGRIPAPLVAMVLATVAHQGLGLEGVATLQTQFGEMPRQLPSFALPDVSLAQVILLLGPAFTIALLGAIESLLSAVVADGMAGTRHDSNQELVGQGVANILAPLFGGFAATGAISRTATSIRNGATSPLASIIHVAFLALVILAFAPYVSQVPLCALSAVLVMAAWHMSGPKRFLQVLLHSTRGDAALLVITFLLAVFADLVVAVNTGVVLAALLFMRRMAAEVRVEDLTEESREDAADDMLVYRVDGPMFFGAASRLQETLARTHRRPRVLAIKLRMVPFMDATGVEALRNVVRDFQRQGTRVLLVAPRPGVLDMLTRAGVIAELGEHAVFDSVGEARAAAGR